MISFKQRQSYHKKPTKDEDFALFRKFNRIQTIKIVVAILQRHSLILTSLNPSQMNSSAAVIS